MKTEAAGIISTAAAGLFLIPCTITDIRKQQIKRRLLLTALAGALIWDAVQIVLIRRLTWEECLISLLPGTALIGLSLLSGGRIGMGDGLAVLPLGLLLGGRDTVLVLISGLFLSAVWSVGLLIRKKAGRETRIPMMPFILAGYCIWEGLSLWKRI